MLRNRFHIISFVIFYVHAITLAQNIPSIGRPFELEIGNWNLEWFGKTESGYGPSNDSLQQAEISKVLSASHIDIWILTEIADTNALNSYLENTDIYGHFHSDYFSEQKTSILFNKQAFRLIGGKLLGTENKDSFSSGRFPLELTLLSLSALFPDTIYLISLHLKSNIGNESQKMSAYNSRKRSSEWLHDYLKNTHINHHCVVAGDWNDDIDLSIYNNLPTPFSKLLSNNFPFTFISKKLSEKKISSTTSYPETIDHFLSSNILAKHCNLDSVFVWRLDNLIAQYSEICSDHYPVISRFDFNSTHTSRMDIPKLTIYPNPSTGKIQIVNFSETAIISILDINGRIINFDIPVVGETIDISHLEPGSYILRICENGECTDNLILLEK